MATAPGISVVVPVYRGEATLEELVERLSVSLAPLCERHEIILVNDCSPDNSWEVVQRLWRARPDTVRGIDLMRNVGQHNALLAGIRAARFDVTVTLDDDLQNPPEEIGRLLEALDENVDVVYGRPETEQHGFLRDAASRLTKRLLTGVLGARTARDVSAFRVFRTSLRDAFRDYSSAYVSIDVLLTWGTSRFRSVVAAHRPRAQGVSNYTFFKLLRHAVNMTVGFSVAPLRIASLLGLAFTLFGAGVLVYVVGRWLISGSVVPGFAFLASTIAIFSGVQLFSLGILGEYVASMHVRMQDKPTYTIRRSTDTEA